MNHDWIHDVVEYLRGTLWVVAFRGGELWATNVETYQAYLIPEDIQAHRVLCYLSSCAARHPLTIKGLYITCTHEFVNVGFTHITMACKHCDQEQT